MATKKKSTGPRARGVSVRQILDFAKDGDMDKFREPFWMEDEAGEKALFSISKRKLEDALEIAREFDADEKTQGLLTHAIMERTPASGGGRKGGFTKGKSRAVTVNSNGAISIGLGDYFHDGGRSESAGKKLFVRPTRNEEGKKVLVIQQDDPSSD